MKLSTQELKDFISNQTDKHTFVLHECIMDRRNEGGTLSILTIDQQDLILCDWSMINDYTQLDVDDIDEANLGILTSEEQEYLLGVFKDEEPDSMVILVCDGVIVTSIE